MMCVDIGSFCCLCHYLKDLGIYANTEIFLFYVTVGNVSKLHYYLGDMWMCYHRYFVVFTIIRSISESMSLFEQHMDVC